MRRTTTSRRPELTRSARAAAIAGGGALAALLAGCVTYEVEPDQAAATSALLAESGSVRIPIDDGAARTPQEQAVVAYYSSVLAQMQAALVDKELDVLHALLAEHDRERAPDWARRQLQRFRRLAVGLAFERRAAGAAQLELQQQDGRAPHLGEAIPLRLRVPAEAIDADIVLPGADGRSVPARFLVRWTVVDRGAFDDVTRRQLVDVVELERSVAFAGEGAAGLQLDYTVPPLPPEGVRREVEVRVALAPGHLLLDGEALPNPRFELARHRAELWPQGIDSVRENPYAHLRTAVTTGDPAHFGNLYAACWLMKPEFRDDALRKLVQGLRTGSPVLGRACAAGLRVLTDLDLSIDDRDAWLTWWQQRASGDG